MHILKLVAFVMLMLGVRGSGEGMEILVFVCANFNFIVSRFSNLGETVGTFSAKCIINKAIKCMRTNSLEIFH